MKNNNILIISKNLTLKKIINKILKKSFRLYFACNKNQIHKQIFGDTQFACILVDQSFCKHKIIKNIKFNLQTYSTPLIFIYDDKNCSYLKDAINIEADDIIQIKKINLELINKILFNIYKTKQKSWPNPLTKLPACKTINKVISKKFNSTTAILYLDLDNFKAYNDKYGFDKGNRVISKTTQIVLRCLKNLSNPDDFLGHIGGDDFILITNRSKSEKIAKQICTTFDKTILNYYDDKSKKDGKIKVKNRLGNLQEYPILSISIAILTCEQKKKWPMSTISQLAAQLKMQAKAKTNGNFKSCWIKAQIN